jgi:hypothetical protein
MSERATEMLEELKAERDAYRRALILHLPVECFAEVDEAFGASGLSNGQTVPGEHREETSERVRAELEFYRRELLKLTPDKTEAGLRALRDDWLTSEQLLAAVEAAIHRGKIDEQRPG